MVVFTGKVQDAVVIILVPKIDQMESPFQLLLRNWQSPFSRYRNEGLLDFLRDPGEVLGVNERDWKGLTEKIIE